ncbi:MAG: peptidase S10, partial [Candidatus Omnitrophica bacterium]|nr:peptidase S10 [Candidatus Omnitrophota bacterium]
MLSEGIDSLAGRLGLSILIQSLVPSFRGPPGVGCNYCFLSFDSTIREAPLVNFFRIPLLLLLLFHVSIALANDTEGKDTEKTDKKKDKVSSATDEIVTTTHEIEIDGSTLRYRAKAGTILMKDEEGEAKAKIFFVAYEKLDVEDVDKRPITFAFNGGPGSSSVWLHLGILGPKRVLLDDDGKAMAPPFSLVDNESSVLDKTDLVFIDPVSTGYSRPAKGEDPKQFHGVQEDVQSVGDFIRLYTTREGRWSSPKFLAGESYGTTRASALSGYLQDRHGMYLNGIVLVSAVLDFQTIRFNVGNDLPYILFFPTYTATAWYHKKLPEDLQSMNLEDLMKESREYAQGPYATALLMGDRLSGEEYAGHVRQIARLTGLSEYYVER